MSKKHNKTNKSNTIIARVTPSERDFLQSINPCVSKALRTCIQHYQDEMYYKKDGFSTVVVSPKSSKRTIQAQEVNDRITSTNAYKMLRATIRRS